MAFLPTACFSAACSYTYFSRSTANFFEEWAKNAVPIISRPGALCDTQFCSFRFGEPRRGALDASDAADCCPAASAPIARAAGPHEEARADAHTDVGEAAAEATGTEAIAAVLAACLRRLSQPPAIPSPERLVLIKKRTPTLMWAKLQPKRRAPESSPRSP